VAAIEASIPSIEYEVSRAEVSLAVLTGTRPGELNADLSPRTYPAIAKVLPIGNPGDCSSAGRCPSSRTQACCGNGTPRHCFASLFPQVSVSGFVFSCRQRQHFFYRELESLFRFSRPIVVGV